LLSSVRQLIAAWVVVKQDCIFNCFPTSYDLIEIASLNMQTVAVVCDVLGL
jgi:hypothetical protein